MRIYFPSQNKNVWDAQDQAAATGDHVVLLYWSTGEGYVETHPTREAAEAALTALEGPDRYGHCGRRVSPHYLDLTIPGCRDSHAEILRNVAPAREALPARRGDAGRAD